ncbi:A24 family peptidase [Microvirga terricola]|uniref:Peptidase n=1 Tax=Microvirga terricola TaxID=2719797 RepID=A0ABX0VEW6_9HYPH|nr:prepilin peptidase [Microvirga terricola]NIX78385.1 peptidase [Microvirga terricola]
MAAAIIAKYIASLCFVVAIIWAGAADLVTMQIRNRLILFLLTSYAVFAPLSGVGWSEIGWAVTSAGGILLFMFVLFGFGWVGGGDAKLAAVVALWLGADHTLAYVLHTALFGGIFTILILQFRLTVLPVQCLTVPWIMRLHAPGGGVPYGVAIAAAALFVFPATHWMQTLA